MMFTQAKTIADQMNNGDPAPVTSDTDLINLESPQQKQQGEMDSLSSRLVSLRIPRSEC